MDTCLVYLALGGFADGLQRLCQLTFGNVLGFQGQRQYQAEPSERQGQPVPKGENKKHQQNSRWQHISGDVAQPLPGKSGGFLPANNIAASIIPTVQAFGVLHLGKLFSEKTRQAFVYAHAVFALIRLFPHSGTRV